jgi:mannose-1-phosphate guanylyltransferase
MAAHIDVIGAAAGSASLDKVMGIEFEKIVGKSIDYAVMERHDNVVVIEAPFDWDDVGSWQAISRLNPPDAAGNSARGLHVPIDTTDTIVYGTPEHAIVTIDVKDLIVVHTADATLVASKRAEERVREAVKELEVRGLEEFL